jgi:hypothetical protein
LQESADQEQIRSGTRLPLASQWFTSAPKLTVVLNPQEELAVLLAQR